MEREKEGWGMGVGKFKRERGQEMKGRQVLTEGKRKEKVGTDSDGHRRREDELRREGGEYRGM